MRGTARARPWRCQYQHIDAIGPDGRRSRPDDLQLHGDVGQAEDRTVLAVACRKALQQRQPDQVPVEPDRLVVVGARTADADRTDGKVLGQRPAASGRLAMVTAYAAQAPSLRRGGACGADDPL